jgi:hypothetical protein
MVTSSARKPENSWGIPVGHAVEVWRLVTEILLECRESDCTKGGVVPQDIDNVRRLSVFLIQLGELLVERLVLGGPSLAVLHLEDVVLGVVDDVCRSGAPDNQHSK